MPDSMRKCIGCRKSHPKDDLIRIVKTPKGNLELDLKHSLDGRGAYVCRSVDCVQKVKEKNGLAAAFKMQVDQEIYLDIAKAVHEARSTEIHQLLGFAVKARKALRGTTAVVSGIKRGKVNLVLVDGDREGDTLMQITSLAQANAIPIIIYKKQKQPFDLAVGKANCRCVGIVDREFAAGMFRIHQKNINQ